MKINYFRGDLTDISAKKEALDGLSAKVLAVSSTNTRRRTPSFPAVKLFRIKVSKYVFFI